MKFSLSVHVHFILNFQRHDVMCYLTFGCEIPGDPPHGRFYFEHNNSVSLFVCDEGFRQTGARVRYCNGYKWHGIPPKCKDKYPSREIRQQQELNFTTTTLSPEEVADKQLLQDILDADNTCFTSYKPPPELSNATTRIQYKYNSVRRQWIMIANYSCNDGFKLKNIFTSYLYCKSYNWTTSIQPECVPEIPEKNPCESPKKGGCEQLCEYHGGTSYSCLCKEGFARKDNYFGCDDIDECRLGNGGCQQTCNNLPGSYFCSCRQGYITSGSRCIDVDECASIETNNCRHGNCLNIPGSYRCNCSILGYTPSTDGTTCQDIDECEENMDDCEDTCINTDGSYKCGCSKKGYRLGHSGKICEDVDECRHFGKRRCTFGNCRNTIGSFECICNEGYRQSKNKRKCKDINECESNNGGCSSLCSNVPGNFTCSCFDGYYLDDDGKTCIDKDECISGEAVCADRCINTVGSYQCDCIDAFEVLDADQINCRNCHKTEYLDTTQGVCKPCPPNSHTVEMMDSSIDDCVCNQGFIQLGNDCVDYDECQANTLACQHLCINTPGSASCACYDGFEVTQNDINCTDINECELENDGCEHICTNSDGSYICSCNKGYLLGFDGKSCEDVDECFERYINCSHICVNTEGSAYCSCPAGYVLQSDNSTCTDLNECAAGISVCEDVCINTEGSYRCDCSGLGLKLSWDLASCSDINECMEGINFCEDVCINTYGSYRCACSRKSFTLTEDGFHCQDINECSSNTTNKCHHICINTVGHYRCDCYPGYALATFSDCAACGQGTYRRAGDPECVRCPKYSITNGVAKTNITECTCLPGFQGNAAAGEDCIRIL